MVLQEALGKLKTMTSTPDSSAAVPDRLSELVGAISPSATLAVDSKAKALKAQGEQVIGFAAGEPDFPTPSHIVEAATQACLDPANHRYTPAVGLMELRQAIAAKTQRDSGLEVEPTAVVVTCGGKHAVYNAFAALLNPGDEVLLPAPYWTTYPEPIRLFGGIPVVLPTSADSGFRVSVEQLEAARTPQTKALLFCSPSNPTGAVYSREEIIAIGECAASHGLWVLTDEIYEHLTYGSHRHYSMPVEVPDVRERCVIVNGVAKTYAMTGWRVGWIIAPPHFVKLASTLQTHQTSNIPNVSQQAAVAALTGSLDSVAEMRQAFDRRRQLMHAGLTAIDGVACLEPEGAFYAFPSFEAFVGQTIGGHVIATTLDLAEVALDVAKIAFVPGEAFGAPGYGRLSFALSDDDLQEGMSRLAALLAG